MEFTDATSRGMRGSVLIETSAVVVLLLIFASGMLDIGRLIHHYIVLTQIANEAARLGTRTPNLEVGTFTSRLPAVLDSGKGGTSAVPVPPGHGKVHWRMRTLLALRREQFSLQNVDVTSTYLTPASLALAQFSGEDARMGGAVRVTIRAVYRGFFPGLRALPLETSLTGEYLLR